MIQEPMTLVPAARSAVGKAIRDHCIFRDWKLLAIGARSNHEHVVLGEPTVKPELILQQLKQWATRRLREAGLAEKDERIWADHGSTRYLYEKGGVEAAVHYVQTQDGGKGPRFKLERPR